jgi:hypothetical protein
MVTEIREVVFSRLAKVACPQEGIPERQALNAEPIARTIRGLFNKTCTSKCHQQAEGGTLRESDLPTDCRQIQILLLCEELED